MKTKTQLKKDLTKGAKAIMTYHRYNFAKPEDSIVGKERTVKSTRANGVIWHDPRDTICFFDFPKSSNMKYEGNDLTVYDDDGEVLMTYKLTN